MKTIHTQTKQRGFLEIGLGLVLLAIFGGAAAIIVPIEQDRQESAEVWSSSSGEEIAKSEAGPNP